MIFFQLKHNIKIGTTRYIKHNNIAQILYIYSSTSRVTKTRMAVTIKYKQQKGVVQMKESANKTGTTIMSEEYLNTTIINHVVNKWWYKFCFGIFTDEQYERFLNDIEFYELDMKTVVTQILLRKRRAHENLF